MSDVAGADTPVPSPPSRTDVFKGFLGDLARPFAVISTSFAASWAIVILANKVAGPEAAIFIGAVLAGVGALYGAKSWENNTQAKQTAAVAVAQAKAAPLVAAALPAGPITDAGELSERDKIG